MRPKMWFIGLGAAAFIVVLRLLLWGVERLLLGAAVRLDRPEERI